MKRFDLGFLQRQVADKLGVSTDTIRKWEGNATTPICQYYKPIVQFLGYNPFPNPQTIGEQLLQYRKLQGLSQGQFAKKLGVDQGTLGRWERGERKPHGKFLVITESFLEAMKWEITSDIGIPKRPI